MQRNKIFLIFFILLTFTYCSSPAKNPQNKQDSTQQNSSATNNESGNNIVYTGSGRYNDIWGVWGGGDLSSADIAKYPFFKGWYIVYQWKKLEPTKDNFDWNYFDTQMKFAADNNLSIGFMVWVGPHSPDWLYTNGVPQVTTQTKKKNTEYPFYLNATYKDRYYNMMKQVYDHIQKMPVSIKDKIVMWMSAEGSTGDVTPYKGYPADSKYNITEDQWFSFKKDAWTYMYKMLQSSNPKIHLLINQGNSGQYFTWLTTNLPKVWMKAGNISHTYQFNGELEYYNRLKKLETNVQQDSTSSRLRGEITVQGKWFNQNESWNMYALLTSALHFGLDIFNTSPKYLQNPVDTITFNFFNLYAGQKVAKKSPGAFCILRDGLDAADTKRFPESKYGPVIDPAKMDAYQKELQKKSKKDFSGDEDDSDDENDDGSDEGINASNAKNDNLSQQRIDKILAEYAPYGAKRGDMNNLAAATDSLQENANQPAADNNYMTPKQRARKNPYHVPKNPDRAAKMQSKQEAGGNDKGTNFQKEREANMVINDIGVNLIPDNYYRFLTQYSPNTTSRGWWRVGPADQPYGRFARSFDAQHGMTEMFFALDKNFFTSNSSAQKVAVRIIYLDQGTGSWSLNYFDGKNKKEAYKITCANTGKWITKTVVLDDAYFSQKLEHATDVSIKYISGDNSIFNSIEILRQ